MAETIEESGGNILYKTLIKKILTKDNAVSRVVTDEGKHLPGKIIIRNSSTITTLNKMLPSKTLSPNYINRTNGFRPSISTFIIWLGLNRELSETIKDCRITVSSGRGAEADYSSYLEGEVEEVPASITIYDNYYKGYSKPGTSTVIIITMNGYKP